MMSPPMMICVRFHLKIKGPNIYLKILLVLGVMGSRVKGMPCGNKTCGYLGRCETNENTLQQECVCDNFWTGDECTISPCDENPCLNGGTCHISWTSYENPFNCQCTPEWEGSLCQTQLTEFQSNIGREFIFAFPENYKNFRGPKITILSSTSRETDIRVSIDGLNFTTSLTIDGHSVNHVRLPTSATIRNTNLNNKTLLVEASDDITVFGVSNDHPVSTDTFLALPVNALGTEYRVVGAFARPRKLYKSQFVISGVLDNTTVRILHRKILEYQGKTHLPRNELILTINRLESIQFQSDEDLTTTWIRSTKPISVMSGSRCGFIKTESLSKKSCEFMMMQLIPVEYWGRRFTLSPLGRSDGIETVVRVLSSSIENNVIRSDRSSRGATLDYPSSFYEFLLTGDLPVNLVSFKPIMVVLYTSYTSITCRNVGDKCKGDAYFGQTMTQVPPHGLHYNTANFSTKGLLPRFVYNLNILTKCKFRHLLYLDDFSLAGNIDWLQSFEMCTLSLEIASKNYRVWSTKSNALFMAHVMGVRKGAAVSFPVGFKLCNPDTAYTYYNTETAATTTAMTTTGKEFVFAFMVSSNSYTDKEPKVVMIADKDSDTDTHVTISTRETTYSVVIPPGGSRVLALPSQVFAISAYLPRPPAAIQVESSLPITVYGLNDGYQYSPRSDGFRVLSTDRLGTEYFLVSSYDPYGSYGEIRAQFVVIGLHDNTEVSLKLASALFFDGAIHYGGTTLRVRVQPLQTLYFASNDHQVGTHVISNKPVSILSGSDCGYGNHFAYEDDTPEVWPCEHQVEHMVPVQSWGRNFVFKEFDGYEGSDMYVTIIAARDGTFLQYPDQLERFLNSGGTFQYTTGPNFNQTVRVSRLTNQSWS